MKQIIKNKIYNTTTAKCITEDGVLSVNKCTTCKELYITKKGNFFIYYITMWQGEKNSITPISIEEAFKFYTENVSSFDEDVVKKYFSNIKIEEA